MTNRRPRRGGAPRASGPAPPGPPRSRSRFVTRCLRGLDPAEIQAAFDRWSPPDRAAAVVALCQAARDRRQRDPRGAARLVAAAGLGVPGGRDRAARGRWLTERANDRLLAGDFQGALGEYRAARTAYRRAGRRPEANRLGIGIMGCHLRLGRYGEAIRVGRRTLAGLPPGAAGDRVRCLVNLGIVEKARERYLQAEAYFRRALGGVRRLRDPYLEGAVYMDLANVQASRDRPVPALALYQRARDAYRAADQPLLAALVECNVAMIREHQGQWGEALRIYEQVRGLARRLGWREDIPAVELRLASLWVRLRRFDEAEPLARRLWRTFQRRGMPREEAKTLRLLAAAAAGRRDWPTAAAHLREAQGRFQRQRLPIKVGFARMDLAAIALQIGEVAQARRQVQGARRSLRRHPRLRLKRQLLTLLEGRVQAAAGQTGAAVRTLRRFLRATPPGFFPPALIQAHATLATLLPARRRWHLTRAVELAERHRGQLPVGEGRWAFAVDTQALYQDWAVEWLRGDRPPDRVFAALELARGRTLLDQLDSAAVRPGLARVDQPLQQQLRWHYARAMEEIEGGDLPGLRAAEAEFQRARTLEVRLARRARRVAPSRGALPSADVPSLAEVQRSLPAGTVALSFHPVRERLHCWVLDRRAARPVPVPLPASDLRDLVGELRFLVGHAMLQPRGARGQALEALLTELGERLLTPAAPELARARHVLIAPGGPLHGVPFHALPVAGERLGDRCPVRYVPALGLWPRLRPVRVSPTAPPVLIGAPDRRRPRIGRELATLRRRFRGARTFGDEGIEEALARPLEARFLHLAAHILFRADNPLFSPVQLGEGYHLTPWTIAHARLKTRLVTVSGCAAGRVRVFPGEEVFGLGRAFLLAGVRTLVLSLWELEDEVGAAFTADLYARLARGLSAAAALRESQRTLRRRFPSPAHWAPLFVLGRDTHI